MFCQDTGTYPPFGAHPSHTHVRVWNSCAGVQAHVREVQQKLTAANGELQQLQAQSNSFTYQEKQALGVKSRAAHKVAQLQVRGANAKQGAPPPSHRVTEE